MMCRLLKVSRSGYYDWSQRAESARSLRDRELRLLIRQIHLESNGVYGARKIHRELLALGEDAGPPSGGASDACRQAQGLAQASV
jgi:hypothetical protein